MSARTEAELVAALEDATRNLKLSAILLDHATDGIDRRDHRIAQLVAQHDQVTAENRDMRDQMFGALREVERLRRVCRRHNIPFVIGGAS